MKVKDLIKILKGCADDGIVCTYSPDEEKYVPVTGLISGGEHNIITLMTDVDCEVVK